DGHKRSSIPDDADRRCIDQGEQGLRPPDDSQRRSRLWQRVELHDAAAVGLFCEVAEGSRTAEGVSHRQLNEGIGRRLCTFRSTHEQKGTRRYLTSLTSITATMLAIGFSYAAPVYLPQTAVPGMSFEVASVKINKTTNGFAGGGCHGIDRRERDGNSGMP